MKQPLRNLTAGFLAVAGSTVTPMAMRSPTHTGWPLSSQVATANKPVALEEVDFIQPPSEMWRFVHNADALARVRINKSRVFMDSHGYVLTEHSATLGPVSK